FAPRTLLADNAVPTPARAAVLVKSRRVRADISLLPVRARPPGAMLQAQPTSKFFDKRALIRSRLSQDLSGYAPVSVKTKLNADWPSVPDLHESHFCVVRRY